MPKLCYLWVTLYGRPFPKLYVVAYLNMALYSLRNVFKLLCSTASSQSFVCMIIFPTDYLTTYLSSLVPRSVTRRLMAFTLIEYTFRHRFQGEVVPTVLNHPPIMERPIMEACGRFVYEELISSR